MIAWLSHGQSTYGAVSRASHRYEWHANAFSLSSSVGEREGEVVGGSIIMTGTMWW